MKTLTRARAGARTSVTAVAAAVVTSALLVAAPPAQAATAGATVVSTPSVLRISADLGHANVRVTYRCTNTSEVRYYLDGMISQDAVPDTYYSIGYRNATGLVEARCTGRRVTQTFRFLRSWWWGAPAPQPELQAGPADFTFHLDARGASGEGWYLDLEPDAIVHRTVTLVTP